MILYFKKTRYLILQMVYYIYKQKLYQYQILYLQTLTNMMISFYNLYYGATPHYKMISIKKIFKKYFLLHQKVMQNLSWMSY